MIIRKQTVRFSPDRKPMPTKVKIGYESDNMVERLMFVLPDIAENQTATMMMDGEYANMAMLTKTEEDDRYYIDLTAERVGVPGETECYIVIDGENGEVWNSGVFCMTTGDIPDVSGELSQRYPDAIEQMREDIAVHRAEMAEQQAKMDATAAEAQVSAVNAAKSETNAQGWFNSALNASLDAQRARSQAESAASNASIAKNQAITAAEALNSPAVEMDMLEPGAEATGAWDTEAQPPVLRLGIPRGEKGEKGDDAPQIDDERAAAANPWSGRGTADRLCPEFEESGGIVTCRPVEGYPLGVRSRIEAAQEGSGDPSPENVRPIRAWDGVKLTRSGKNLIGSDLLNTAVTINGVTAQHLGDGVYLLNGTATGSGKILVSDGMDIRAHNRPVAVSCEYISGKVTIPDGGNAVYFVGASDVPTNSANFVNTGLREENTCNVKISNMQYLTETWFYFMGGVVLENYRCRVQVEINAEATPFEPYQSNAYTVRFGKTVCSGSYNWQTGELSVEWECRALDGSEEWKMTGNAGTGNAYYHTHIGDLNTYVNFQAVCSHYPQAAIGTATTANGVRVLNSSSANEDRLLFRPDLSVYDTADKWKAYLAAQAAAGTPVTVAYQRTEPETIQLEPQELPALSGENCLYSDSGETQVSGRADPRHIIAGLEERIAALEAAVLSETQGG